MCFWELVHPQEACGGNMTVPSHGFSLGGRPEVFGLFLSSVLLSFTLLFSSLSHLDSVSIFFGLSWISSLKL
jgi:hypothetical protein